MLYGFHRVWPEEGPRYFAALGRSSPGRWTKDFAILKAKWGDVAPGSLRFPWTPLCLRPLLVGTGTALPEDVLVVIPIYADTTEAEKDHVWRLAMKAKRAWYSADRTGRRARADIYTRRLRVWDAYEQTKNFARVGKQLGIPATTVRGLFLKACADIYGSAPLGRVAKKRRTFGFHPEDHAANCQRCRNPKIFEEMCPAARAYALQDHGALREIQAGKEPSAPVQRRNPGGSDRQFKKKLFQERITGSRTR